MGNKIESMGLLTIQVFRCKAEKMPHFDKWFFELLWSDALGIPVEQSMGVFGPFESREKAIFEANEAIKKAGEALEKAGKNVKKVDRILFSNVMRHSKNERK